MPIVPQYNQQDGPAPLPGVRVTPDAPSSAFGVPSTPDLRGAQGVVSDMVDRERARADQIAVLDADNQMSDAQEQILRDPQTGVLNQRGKNALGTPDSARQQWQQATGVIEQGLATDQQKMMFQRMAAGRWASINETVQGHVADQIRALDEDTTKTFLEKSRQDAVTAGGDPTKIKLALARQAAVITDYGQRNGLPSEVTAQRIADAASQTHAAVLGQMLDAGQDLAAKDYFAANKDALTGTDLGPIEKAMREGTVRGESQRQFDAIIADPSLSLNDAVKRARAVPDADVRAETERLVRTEYTERAEGARQQEEEGARQGANIIDQTGDYHNIPTTLWSQLKPSQRSELIGYAKARAEGVQPHTNFDTFYRLLTMASADDPTMRDQFTRTNLLGYRSELSDADFRTVVEAQASLRKGERADVSRLGGDILHQDVVNGVMRGAGWYLESRDPGDIERAALFRQRVREQNAALEQTNGRVSSSQEVQEVANDLMIKGVTQKNDERRLFELQPGEQFIFGVSDIPYQERQSITQALRARGIPTTDQNVIRAYTSRVVNPMVQRMNSPVPR